MVGPGQKRRELETLETRPHTHIDERDTAVLVSVANQDRRPPHGTSVAQLVIYIEEGFKARTGNIGKCPHCKRDLRIRLTAQRMHS